VFYQPTRLVWRKLGYMVNAGVSAQGLVFLEVVPYRIHDLGVSLLDIDESSRFFKKINDISRPLEKKAGLMDTWHGFLDYYGVTGFEKEIAMIMEKLQVDPVKGAAMFRNRLTTLQHFHHFKDLMTRIIKGEMNTSPGWARDLTREWLTLVCDENHSKPI
jgi:poly-gamma-glutamate synthesis protein (capsule biosynthesis protein)